jgi:hypothetical protein
MGGDQSSTLILAYARTTHMKFRQIKLAVCDKLATPWTRVLLGKQLDLRLVEKQTAFHGTRRFITVFTAAHHFFFSFARRL